MPVITLRYLGIPVLFIGHVLFRVFFRKKTWREMRQDVAVTDFFIGVYVCL